MYDETVARKGSDDVCSMFHDFATRFVSNKVKHLDLFCDGCAGQNKNWTVMRFLYYLVHSEKRFDSILLAFPIRGHSYMECDKDMSKVDQKARTEIPSD